LAVAGRHNATGCEEVGTKPSAAFNAILLPETSFPLDLLLGFFFHFEPMLCRDFS
jgi:hypothetical protein